MSLIENTNRGRHPLMAFLLGLLSTNNIVYAFVVGSTPILVICVYAFLCLAWLALTHTSRISMALSSVPKLLWAFILCLFFSVIFVILFNIEYMYQWVVGIIALLLYSTVVLLVIALKDNRSSIIKGIVVGIVINAILVLYAYVLYKTGTMFTLSHIFPVWGIDVQLSYNSFRGWGLFLEPGHLMRYVAIMTLVVYTSINRKNKLMKWTFIISVAAIITFTVSSAIAIFAVGLILFIILSGKVSISKCFYMLVILAVAIFGFYGLSRVSAGVAEIWDYFVNGLFDISGGSSGDDTRITGMKNTLKIIMDYPIIGCGYGIFTKVFQEAGYYVDGVKGSYSRLLTLVAQIGIGVFTYLAYLYSSVRDNLKKKDISCVGMACAIIVYFALFVTTDYSLNGDSAVFIGLMIVNGLKIKESNVAIK